MEISPYILVKMLFVAFLFSMQAGVAFDFGRALRSFFSFQPKSPKIKSLYGVKVPFSDKPLRGDTPRKINRFFENATVFFFDLFLMIYSGIGLVKINFSYNDGVFRFFTVFAFLVGFLLYYLTLSRMILFLLELLFFVIKYLTVTLFGIFEKPFLIIYNNLVKKIKKKYEKFRLDIEKKHKVVYNVEEILCNDENIGKKRLKICSKAHKAKKEGYGKNERQ